MINYLNTNQGLISAAGIIISIAITVVGFLITNKNIIKIKQNQNVRDGAKGFQGGRDAIDNSTKY